MVIAALAALGMSGAVRFAVKRRLVGEPVGPFLFGAGAIAAALVATVLVIAGETDTGVAGYVLALPGLVLAVVQLSRSP
jgi:fumarate reductase subunit D